MKYERTFTIEEARSLLPRIRKMIVGANDELELLAEQLERDNKVYEDAEQQLSEISVSTDQSAVVELRESRKRFQEAIEQLSKSQNDYLQCLNKWVDELTGIGIILRDLRSGLIDFPAQQGDMEYFLCWKLSDDNLEYWHLVHDGFTGRRPLAVLAEYV